MRRPQVSTARVVGGRESKGSHLFDSFAGQVAQDAVGVGVDHDAAAFDLARGEGFAQVQAGIGGLRVFGTRRQKGYLMMTGVLAPTPSSR